MDFKKLALTGIIALTPILGAGAAMAANANYTVATQDTMYLIAKRNGVSLTALIQANPQVTNPDIIWPGMKLNIPQTGQSVTQPNTNIQQPSANKGSLEQQVVTLVNQERAKAGLSPLVSDAPLAKMAYDKAVDMENNRYFDHNSPTYGSPFDMMKTYGIQYNTAGENIATGQTSAQQVMTDWMNSPGHRANILNSGFTKIGVGYYQGEWVQEFIG
ncbi:CAP domain-containing protein [Paenibacillus swuensis]